MLEHRLLRPAVLDYLGMCRCTPHATTRVASAVALHGRLPRTRRDVVGHSSPSFFKDPAGELRRLRQRVKRKQDSSRSYTDHRRAARKTKVLVGDFVRVKEPSVAWKGDLSFSRPRKVVGQRGPSSFRLDDGRTWNASKLSKVPVGSSTLSPGGTWDPSARRYGSSVAHWAPELFPASTASAPVPVEYPVSDTETHPLEDPTTVDPGPDAESPSRVDPDAIRPDSDSEPAPLVVPSLPTVPAAEQQEVPARRFQPPRERRAPDRYGDHV